MADPVSRPVARPMAPDPRDMAAQPDVELMHPDTHQLRNPLEGQVIEALKQIFDPEIPVNIYDLGLIYDLSVSDDGIARIRMTLTAPGCPVAGEMPLQVGTAAETVDGVNDAHVELVWEPAWTKDRMSEDAKLALGFF